MTQVFDFRKDRTTDLAGVNTDEAKGRFLRMMNGKDDLILKLRDDQWFFLTTMLFDELPEEEQKQIAEMHFHMH